MMPIKKIHLVKVKMQKCHINKYLLLMRSKNDSGSMIPVRALITFHISSHAFVLSVYCESKQRLQVN